VLLEEQLGYEEVTIRTSDLDSVYEAVAEGSALFVWVGVRLVSLLSLSM
jgi:hypothetical protein